MSRRDRIGPLGACELVALALCACEPRAAVATHAAPSSVVAPRASESAAQLASAPPPSRATPVAEQPREGPGFGRPNLDPEPPVPKEQLDPVRVRVAYEAVLAGRNDDARRLFAAFGRAQPVHAAWLERRLNWTEGAPRGLLPNAQACDYGNVGAARCDTVSTRDGGSCTPPLGTLVARCPSLAFDRAGVAVAVFQPAEAKAIGQYLVTYGADAATTVRDIADFQARFVTRGEIVAEVGGALIAVERERTKGKPQPSYERANFRAWVVDVKRQRAQGPCRLGAGYGEYGQRAFHVLAEGTRLLTFAEPPSGNVLLCDVATGRTLFQSPIVGFEPWQTDAKERMLYLSGLPVRSPRTSSSLGDESDFNRTFEHVALDLHTGASARVRTKHSVTDIAALTPSLSRDGSSLLVASHLQVTLLATKPLRVQATVSLETVAKGWDSSENLSPILHLLSEDGRTVLALFDLRRFGDDQSALQTEAWLISLGQRKVLLHGWLTGNVLENPSTREASFEIQPQGSNAARQSVIVDAQGKVTRRALPALDSLRSAGTMPKIPNALAVGLAPQLCWVDGLFVPQSACPR